MGLMIHSLEGLKKTYIRDYYIYLLDYGWNEPLGQALRKNFSMFADISTDQKNTVVVMRTDQGIHFNDEVLSYHSINGDDVDSNQLLPAVLITNCHPLVFKENKKKKNLKLILFPLKKYCHTTSQVISLIQEIFSNIQQGKDLNDFKITEYKKRGIGGALADSIILEPNFPDASVSFSNLLNFLNNG